MYDNRHISPLFVSSREFTAIVTVCANVETILKNIEVPENNTPESVATTYIRAACDVFWNSSIEVSTDGHFQKWNGGEFTKRSTDCGSGPERGGIFLQLMQREINQPGEIKNKWAYCASGDFPADTLAWVMKVIETAADASESAATT